MIPVSFHVDESSFSLEFDAVITLQQYGAYFTVMMKNDSYRQKITGVGIDQSIFLCDKRQLDVSLPLLNQLSSSREVRIGRVITQSVTWENHVCDVPCYSGFTVNEFLLYCIPSLRLSGSADCYCVLRKDRTEIPSWTVIPFQGFKEEITLVNRNTIKKPQEPKSAINSSGISGCP